MVADNRLDEAVGSVAEEAARLLETLRRHSAGTEPAEDPAADPAGETPAEDRHADHEHVPMGEAQACTYCPICQGVVLLRSVSPETLDRLADVAGALAALLGDLASSRAAGEQPAPARRPRAERIDVVDEED